MAHPSDVTDAQWELIPEFFGICGTCGHLRKHDERELVNAVLYLVKTGCHWRKLPKDFTPHSIVWSFYRYAAKMAFGKRLLANLPQKQGKGLVKSLNQVIFLLILKTFQFPARNAGLAAEKKNMPEMAYNH